MSTTQSLYDIKSNLCQLFEFLEVAETDEERDAVKEGLVIAQGELNEKALNYSKFIRNESATCEAIDFEIKRLQALKKVKENKIGLLKLNLSDALKAFDIKKLDLGIFKISFRKSQSLEVTDQAQIPEMFIKEKVIKEVDKKRLKEAIKALEEADREIQENDPTADLGEPIPGAYIKTNFSLQIK